MKQRFSLAVLFALALILFSLPLSAQDFRGAISGIVKDSTGAVLPGVTLTVKNVETNVSVDVGHRFEGRLSAPHLNAGTYSVEAELDGFKTQLRKAIVVHVGDTVAVDFKMEQGGSDRSHPGDRRPRRCSTPPLRRHRQVIDSTQIQRLPLGDGTAYMLTRLAPGLIDSSDLHFDAADGQRQPGRHHRQRRAGRATSSPSTARRTGFAEHQRARQQQRRRRLLASLRRHRGVQGSDERLRRRSRVTPPAPP